MTTIIIIFSIFTFGISLLALLKLSTYISHKFFPNNIDDYKTKPTRYIIFLVILSFLLIALSPLLPFIFTFLCLSPLCIFFMLIYFKEFWEIEKDSSLLYFILIAVNILVILPISVKKVFSFYQSPQAK